MSADRATRILAIRHGETDWNAAARIQGHTDIGLNARGHWQAGQTALALGEETLDAIYSSDLARAHQTAQPLADRTGAPLQLTPGLRERGFGSFEGLSFDQIEQRWPLDARRWRDRDVHFAPGGGEALTAFYDRCVDAALQLAARHPGGSIALVAHGGVLDCLYRAATRTPLDAARSWVLGNASINRLLYSDQGLTLVGWNDVQHLEGAAVDERFS